MTKPTLHLIGGPTASGKSALALELGERENGVIINADAMQIYAGMPVLTAQPAPAAQNTVPHRLYGMVEPSERYSVAKWVAEASEILQKCADSGQTAILVGGTGLYFKALLEGLSEIPNIPDKIRAETQALYERLGSKAFRAELGKLDAESARNIKANDRQRLIRAYEVALATGEPITAWRQRNKSSLIGILFHVKHRLVMPERETLYAACDTRFLQMIDHGALAEVRALLARRLDPHLPVMKILGVRELAAYLSGDISLDAAITKAQQATRNYAKRQVTWFRNQWAKDSTVRAS